MRTFRKGDWNALLLLRVSFDFLFMLPLLTSLLITLYGILATAVVIGSGSSARKSTMSLT